MCINSWVDRGICLFDPQTFRSDYLTPFQLKCMDTQLPMHRSANYNAKKVSANRYVIIHSIIFLLLIEYVIKLDYCWDHRP